MVMREYIEKSKELTKRVLGLDNSAFATIPVETDIRKLYRDFLRDYVEFDVVNSCVKCKSCYKRFALEDVMPYRVVHHLDECMTSIWKL